MDFTISKIERRQQYLAGLLVVLVLLALYFWKGRDLLGPSAQVMTPQFHSKNVNINFTFLESSVFNELRTFEEIQPFEGEVGQVNPFVTK